jgi:hypothetical protein
MKLLWSVLVISLFLGCGGGGGSSGETSETENPASGETSETENPSSGETSETENPSSGETSETENPASSETSETENPTSGDTSETENSSTSPLPEELSPYQSQFQPDTEVPEGTPTYTPPPEEESEYIGDIEVKTLSEIVTTTTLSREYIWRVSGTVTVTAGTVLSIEDGTTIFGEDSSSILVFEKGSQIKAIGKKSSPIIFTSKDDISGFTAREGAWGGIEMNGDGESSGTLKYVQIRYGGSRSFNGVEFINCGLGTVVEYLQVYKSARDGVILNGGDINLRNIVISGVSGDSLLIQNSWGGKIHNLYIRQESGVSINSSGIQIDGEGSDKMIISNMTLHSLSSDAGSGIYTKSGSYIHLLNSIITGNRAGRCVEAEDSMENIENNYIFNSTVLGKCDGGSTWATDLNGRDSLKILFSQDENYVRENILSFYELALIPQPVEPSSVNSWFDNYREEYIGAFNSSFNNRWSDEWTVGVD